MCIGTSCAIDGFENQRVSDLLGGLADFFVGTRSKGVGDAETCGGDSFFHALFIAKVDDVFGCHAWECESFAYAGGCCHERFPERFDVVHSASLHPAYSAFYQIVFIEDTRDLEIVGEVVPYIFGEGMYRLVTYPKHAGTDFCQSSCEVRHFSRI